MSLQWVDYPVVAREGESLMTAINRASRIRQGGQVFNGFTDWHIEWRFRWEPEPSGQCRLVERQVGLRTVITLPRLESAPDAHRAVFNTYLASLRTHEIGHHEIARRAAQDLDTALARLGPLRDCAVLRQTVDQLGNRHLEQARRQGVEYDRQTDHGATQGARLPR